MVQLAFLIVAGVAALLVSLPAIAVLHRNIAGSFLLISGVGIALGSTAIEGINYCVSKRFYSSTFDALRRLEPTLKIPEN